MRILFDIPEFAMGGMERQVVGLGGGLVSRGHEVVLVVNKSATDAYRDLIESSGIGFTVLGRTNRLDPRVLSDLIGIVHRFAPDVVVAEMFNASLWGRVAGIISGTGVVVAEHSSDRVAPRKVYWTNRLLGPFTHAVVGCARAQVPSLVADGQPEAAIVVVHNAVDTTLFHPDPPGAQTFRAEAGIPEHAFVIGMIAANRPEKRHDRLVSLAERLSAGGVDFVACAIGGGPLYEGNRELAARSPAADRIRFVGPLSDVVAAYSACDVAVLVSDSIETFPLSFLEAQACGTPVVGMRVGGVEESFSPGESGFLVEQGDIDSMAEVIKRMSLDHALCGRMGRAGRSFVEAQYTVEKMVTGYEAVLRRAADAASGRRRARLGQ
jgi:glycosyltransferase involved in cell wall biosynthesis